MSRTRDHLEDIHKSNCHLSRPQEMSNHRRLNEHPTTVLRLRTCRSQQILFLGDCAPNNSCPREWKVLNLKIKHVIAAPFGTGCTLWYCPTQLHHTHFMFHTTQWEGCDDDNDGGGDTLSRRRSADSPIRAPMDRSDKAMI